ncbi:MAG: catalase [Oscillospiraceae bacterium]|nr:catalase [Oscillospiraceae bacterium]
MKAIRHFITITKHRHAVMRHCFKAGIPWRGLLHDLSKYSPAEFIPGARYYQGNKSPQVEERRVHGYSAAWLHHKGRNKHHFEYWSDYVAGVGVAPIEMPKQYLIEMFCDRVAACKIYQRDSYKEDAALRYYENAKKHYVMHPNTAAELEKLLVMLSEEGEERTFSYIRRQMLGK